MIGQEKLRVNGPLKVSGRARYAVEYPVDNPAHAVLIKSDIAHGTIASIDVASVEKMPGVIKVIHSGNAMKLKPHPGDMSAGFPGEVFIPFQDENIWHIGQHIAVVLAESVENARLAASRIKITYNEKESKTKLEEDTEFIKPPAYTTGDALQYERGDFNKVKAGAPVIVNQKYSVPTEHHNPMEAAATTALWKEDKLTIYDSTQAVINTRDCVAHCFDLPKENIRVLAYYVGGGFGCKGFFWPHTLVAAMAAKIIGRPVKLNLSRQDMYTSVGHRPAVQQEITLAATKDGKIVGAQHNTKSYTSINSNHFEACGITSARLYNITNFSTKHEYARLHQPTPTPMRGPGEAPGMFALESALDELAEKLDMDPVTLRKINYAPVNLSDDKPYSMNLVKECYDRGASLFGWENRNRQPGQMIKNDKLIGHGMATLTYPANRMGGAAVLTMKADGSVIAETATQDIGTGTYTVMAQIVADELGISSDSVTMKIGDSYLPPGPLSGGSQVTASAGSYLKTAATKLKKELIDMAVGQSKSSFYGKNKKSVSFKNGKLTDGNKEESIATLFQLEGVKEKSVKESSDVIKGYAFGGEAEHAYQSFGAIFVEASVDPDLGVITIPKIVAVFDTGKIINPKLARSQFYGGIIFGYSQALLEATEFDHDTGRIINADLAEYHVPVNADINEIIIDYLDKPDYKFSEHGGKGIGEIGTVGTAGAIANAIYNATGKRIRNLPITLDKLL